MMHSLAMTNVLSLQKCHGKNPQKKLLKCKKNVQIDFTSMTEKITQDDQFIQGSKTQPGGNNLDDNFYKTKKKLPKRI